MAKLSPTTVETIRFPVYSRFLAAITVANVGQFLMGLAVPFLVNDLTDSNAWVGASSFASLVPAVVITPIAGILADRKDRKRLLLAAYAGQTVLTALFVAGYQADQLTPWRILGLQLLAGILSGFQWAPLQSMSAVLVPERLLIDAVRLVSISFTAGRTVGPAIAAVVLATGGPGLAFIATLSFYVVTVALMVGVRTQWQPPTPTEPYLQQFRNGLDYVRAREGMRLAMTLQGAVAFFGAVFNFALVASIADDAYSTGGGGLGALALSAGIGSVIASVYITGAGSSVSRSRVESAAIAIYAGGVLTAAATPHLAVGLVGFLMMGVAQMLSAVTLSTSLQVQVEEEYRGRVMSVWLMVTLALLPVAALIGGFLADALSIRLVMAMFGGALLAFGVIRSTFGAGFSSLDDPPTR